jgi:MFS family permease
MLAQGPIAVKWGRRPVFLIATLLLFASSIWSGASKGLESFKWSRIIQGLGMAPFEALVTASLGDIFFVHELGMRVSIWGFAIIGGINVAPIIKCVFSSSRSCATRTKLIFALQWLCVDLVKIKG